MTTNQGAPRYHAGLSEPSWTGRRDGFPAAAFVHCCALACLLYLLLAVGRIASPSVIDEQPSYFHSMVLVPAILLLGLRRVALSAAWRSLITLLPFLGALAFSAFMTEDWAYAMKKLDSAFLVTPALAAVAAELFARRGHAGGLKLFLLVALCVLALTVAHKSQEQLFDRQSRFLLNGAIVFGWLAGLSCLVSLHLFLTERRGAHWLAIAALFALAVVWTASKGPLLALFLAMLLVLTARASWRSVLALILLPAGAYVLAINLLPDGAMDRLAAIARVLAGETGSADAGSIGTRADALADAAQAFFEHPFLGIGLGNFQFHSYSSLIYPHSFVPEALAEMGLLGAAALLFVIARILVLTSALGRVILAYFAAALSFSGDLGYIHLMLGLPLALAFKDEQARLKGV